MFALIECFWRPFNRFTHESARTYIIANIRFSCVLSCDWCPNVNQPMQTRPCCYTKRKILSATQRQTATGWKDWLVEPHAGASRRQGTSQNFNFTVTPSFGSEIQIAGELSFWQAKPRLIFDNNCCTNIYCYTMEGYHMIVLQTIHKQFPSSGQDLLRYVRVGKGANYKLLRVRRDTSTSAQGCVVVSCRYT